MARKKEETLVSKWTVMSAFVMLLVTITALTTATYAWFTANTTVDLGDLDVNVTATSGIQISMDAVTWKAGLSTADIKGGTYNIGANRGDVNQIPGTLAAVSTTGTVASGKMLFFKGNVTTLNNNFVLTAATSTESAGTRPYVDTTPDQGDFIAFDIFIQTPINTVLYLTSASDVVNTQGNSGLQNAARVAFINMGSATTPEDAKALNAPISGGVKIWEPNASSHTQEAINHASSTYSITTVDDSTATSVATAAANSVINSYYGINGGIEEGVALNTQVAPFGEVTNTLKTVTAQAADTELTNITAGINKIRVYCWIEGQDVDCEDRVSGSGIKYDIAITKVDPVQP